MSYGREREMFTATCGDCGNECKIPFKPRDSRPVYCNECFQKHKPQDRGSGGGGRFGGRSRYGGGSGGRRDDRGSRFDRGPRRDRPMFTATCGDCGNECKIPFKPKEDRPVYCNDCFQNHKQN